MVAAKNGDVQKEYDFWKEIWDLYKKYFFMEDTDEYWETFTQDFIKLSEKYRGKTYWDIIKAVMDEFWRRDKERKGGKTYVINNSNPGQKIHDEGK